MSQAIEDLKKEIEAASISSAEELEAFRLAYISRKGRVTKLLGQIGSVPPEERRSFGQQVNALKKLAQDKFEAAKAELASGAGTARKATDDITLPPPPLALGLEHPLSQIQERIKQVFFRLGFSIAEGPELEDDFHNFTALNFPPEHPARDMQDTFFIRKTEDEDDDLVLRTHTSPVQIRLMQHQPPPVRAIMPGRVYRNESITAKSYCLFHQVEGLYVDKNVSLAELKETLIMFAEMVYGQGVKYRIRPSFFPFTEPSLEMDVWWGDEKDGKWLEILGAGMVHPNVLRAVNIDPEEYSGFAFGMGVERIAMLFYGIDDIRLLYDNDARFLEQFR
ncbi:MAG: phenylalanine--tRNA ligase subunit alpha [Cyclonatronaceae bacterium]